MRGMPTILSQLAGGAAGRSGKSHGTGDWPGGVSAGDGGDR